MMNAYETDLHEAATTSIPWKQLDGCNLMITGASGLIGSCLVDLLMEVCRCRSIRLQVYALGRDEEKARQRFSKYLPLPHFHIMKHDITTPLDGDVCFHYIVHAASNASPQLYQNAPVEVMKANIAGVANLLDYGLQHGMKRFLYVSSGEVYGQHPAASLEESQYGYVDILSPRSCYPSAKRAAETLAVCYAKEYGADVVIARPCHTFGPFFQDSDLRAYAQFIRNIESGQRINLKSDGAQYRSWCYVVDCASALCHILLKGETGTAYNIADKNCESTLRNLAAVLAELGNCPLITGEPDATSNQRVVFDTSRLEALGWKTRGTLREKMMHTLDTRKEAKL